MMNWKRAFYTAVAVLVASNLGWSYLTVDHGVTDTYREVACQETAADLEAMKRLLPQAAPLSRPDLVVLLRRTNPDAFIVAESTSVSMGGLHFQFEGGRLAEVAQGAAGMYGR